MPARSTATPVKAALTGVAVNVALKIALVGSLAQIGLALATAVGAWVNLMLVVFFATRRKFFVFDRAFLMSLVKFAATGGILAAALWLTSRWAVSALAGMTTLRDETALGILIGVGALVYSSCILLLFGRRWLTALVRR